MLANQPFPEREDLRPGWRHLGTNQPGLGKVILVYDPEERNVHLIGNLLPGATKFIGEGLEGEDAIHKALEKAIASRDYAQYLGEQRVGYLHANISFKHLVPNGIVVGGGAAYFDGKTLYLGDYSTEFGPMTLQAIQTCQGNSVAVSYGPAILRGEGVFCEKGATRLAAARRG